MSVAGWVFPVPVDHGNWHLMSKWSYEGVVLYGHKKRFIEREVDGI